MANQLRILLAISLIGLGSLPAQAQTPPTVIDHVAEQPAINQTRFILIFESTIENLEEDDFEYTAGCTLGYLEIQDTVAQVDLIDCPTGLVTLTLKANSLGAGALGPTTAQRFELEIDATEPSATFSEIQIEGSGPFTYTTLLRFSEQVEFDPDTLRFSSDVSCDTSIVAVNGGFRLRASCGYAELGWMLPAYSLRDNAGHQGPEREVKVSVIHRAPAPVVTPAPPVIVPILPPPIPVLPPAPVLPPVMTPPTPTPTPTPAEPVIVITPSESASVPDVVIEPWSESATLPMEPPVFVSIAPAAIALPTLANSAGLNLIDLIETGPTQLAAEESALPVEVSTMSAEPKTSVETVAVSKVDGDFRPQDNSFGVWLIGLGSAMLIALGLIRRFSGR